MTASITLTEAPTATAVFEKIGDVYRLRVTDSWGLITIFANGRRTDANRIEFDRERMEWPAAVRDAALGMQL
jgi:hypothetical protein